MMLSKHQCAISREPQRNFGFACMLTSVNIGIRNRNGWRSNGTMFILMAVGAVPLPLMLSEIEMQPEND